MKKILFAAMAAALFPALAGAEYVCRATYFPYVENTVPGRLRVRLSASSSCTSTQAIWFCDNRAVGDRATCADTRYEPAELLALFQQAARAADSRQIAFAGTTTCSNGASGCGYYLEFSE
jgi:hypothetical protein